MSALSLCLPDIVHRHIEEIAEREGVSVNQFVSEVMAEKVSVILTEDYLYERAKQDIQESRVCERA